MRRCWACLLERKAVTGGEADGAPVQHPALARLLTPGPHPGLPPRERPTLVGKSATKAASQSKRKAQHGGGRPAKQARTQQQQQQGAGGKSGGKSKGGKTKVRRTHAAQVVSKGGAYNLA